jgi:hypothetical protein
VEKIGFVTDMSNDVLVPDFSQQRTAGLFQGRSSLWLLWPAASTANRRFARLAIQSVPKPWSPLYQSITACYWARA